MRLLKPVNEMPGSDSGEVVFYCARRIQTCKSKKKKQGWLMLKPNGSLEYLLYCIYYGTAVGQSHIPQVWNPSTYRP